MELVSVKLSSEIDADTVAVVERALAAARKQRVIVIAIDSPGGSVMAAVQIVNLMNAFIGIVCTYVAGLAASAAAYIFVCGTPGFRFCSPNSTILLHEVSTAIPERVKLQDLVAVLLDVIQANENLQDVISLRTGGPDSDYVRRNADGTPDDDWMVRMLTSRDNGDVRFSDVEAVEAGLADLILTLNPNGPYSIDSSTKALRLIVVIGSREAVFEDPHFDRGMELRRRQLAALSRALAVRPQRDMQRVRNFVRDHPNDPRLAALHPIVRRWMFAEETSRALVDPPQSRQLNLPGE